MDNMDNIIRHYWVNADGWNGEDIEYLFPATRKEEAFKTYNALNAPYKKIVACTYARDIDLEVYCDKEYYAQENA